VESAKAFGVNLRAIHCTSLMDKIPSLLRAIESLSANDLLFVSDGYDCVYTQKAASLQTLMKSFSAEMIFSCTPFVDHHVLDYRRLCATAYAFSTPEYLCSGCFAGRVGAIRNMLLEIIEKYSDFNSSLFSIDDKFNGFLNDQTCFGVFASKNPGLVALDDRRMLSATVGYNDAAILQAFSVGQCPKIFNSASTGLLPCLLHVTTTGLLSYPAFVSAALSLKFPHSCYSVDLLRIRAVLQELRSYDLDCEAQENLQQIEMVWRHFKGKAGFYAAYALGLLRYFRSRCRVRAGKFSAQVARCIKWV
jgi:hypothetical protein